MSARFQLVIDCRDPEPLARFWAAALGYVLEPPPNGFATWDDWRAHLGLPASDLGLGVDSIVDPEGQTPRIWFRVEDDTKVGKNRLHVDLRASGAPSDPFEVRKERVDAEARRLVGLGAVMTVALTAEGLDHYALGMQDPEGNEFDIN